MNLERDFFDCRLLDRSLLADLDFLPSRDFREILLPLRDLFETWLPLRDRDL